MKDPRRPLLIGGVVLLGLGAGLHFAAVARGVAPWLVLAGGLLVALYFVLARLSKAPASAKAESMMFDDGGTTMMDEIDRDRERDRAG